MARRRSKTMAGSKKSKDQSSNGLEATASKQTSGDSFPSDGARGGGLAESRARIEKLAYDLYVRRGYRDGHDLDDWLEAERLSLTEPLVPAHNGGQHPLPSSHRSTSDA